VTKFHPREYKMAHVFLERKRLLFKKRNHFKISSKIKIPKNSRKTIKVERFSFFLVKIEI